MCIPSSHLAVEADDRQTAFFTTAIGPRVLLAGFFALAGIEDTRTDFIGMHHLAGQTRMPSERATATGNAPMVAGWSTTSSI